MVVEPRWLRRPLTEVLGRQDLEIRTDSDGLAVIPRLRNWQLSEANRELGQEPDQIRETTQVLGTLENLIRAGDTSLDLSRSS